jgi:hypothetical protein
MALMADIARRYAKRVVDHSNIASCRSLYPGDDFTDLADFLWRPYDTRPLPLRPSGGSPPTTEHASRFASLYLHQVEAKDLKHVPFETIQEFEDLGDSVIPGAGSFALLVLRGYPSPPWLNALGARFGIDPELFQRHLSFALPHGKSLSEIPAIQTLPSCHEDMVLIQTTTVGWRKDCARFRRSQADLELLRRKMADEMKGYTGEVSRLNCPDMALGDPVVRQFSVHGSDYFSLEQMMSFGAFKTGESWIGNFVYQTRSPYPQGICLPLRRSHLAR